MASPLKIAVIGAGIVGVSTALWLRRDGHNVTVFDRIEPGDSKQTSYGNAGTVRRVATALTDILGDAVEQHTTLAEGTDAAQYITKGSYTFLYKDRAYYEKEALSFSIRAENGFTWDELDRNALLEIDPNLGPASGETHQFDRVTLASGAWSKKLADKLGHSVALETERGYHVMLKDSSIRPPNPYMIGDAKFGLTPMRHQLHHLTSSAARCAGFIRKSSGTKRKHGWATALQRPTRCRLLVKVHAPREFTSHLELCDQSL